jgi:3-oxoacyl-[acyl-carrier-protein] synthase-1
MDVFVTGLGIVTALGVGLETNLDSLKSQQTGIKQNTLLPDLSSDTFVGELSISNSQFKKQIGFSEELNIPRTALLGVLAAKEALGNTSLDRNIRSGFINGTTVGGMDLTENYFREAFLADNHKNFAVTATHDLGSVTNIIANSCGNPGYINTISTACSSSANSIMLGARMIKAGLIDRVLVGGTDAIANFTISGFRSLMIYSDELCKPFDGTRKGLNLGEGAGFILLENDKSLQESKNKVIANLIGWSNANDAFHQTGTSPNGDGATKAMQRALEQANLPANAIDYVNAHGTATDTNDSSESNALSRVFEDNIKFSSTKGYTGHTLGAAGGIEAVISILALTEQSIFPNINWGTPMEGITVQPTTKLMEDVSITNVMSNSFGFGGNSSSLIFSKS